MIQSSAERPDGLVLQANLEGFPSLHSHVQGKQDHRLENCRRGLEATQHQSDSVQAGLKMAAKFIWYSVPALSKISLPF